MLRPEEIQQAQTEMVEFFHQNPNNPFLQAFLKILELRREVNKELLSGENDDGMIRRYQGAIREVEGIVKLLTMQAPSLEENDQLGLLSETPE